MSIIDLLIDAFNPISLTFMIVTLLLGAIIGLLFRPTAINRVLKLIPSDKRFIELEVKQEWAHSLTCKPKKGYPPQRFIKIRSGFTGMIGKILKKAGTLFIGKEGTAYTQQVEEGTLNVITNGNPSPLAVTVKTIWGEEEYAKVPDNLRESLERSKVNVTVQLDEKKADFEKDHPLSEEDLKTEEDVKASKSVWEGKKQAEKARYLEYIFVAGFGAAIMLVASILLGWIKIM